MKTPFFRFLLIHVFIFLATLLSGCGAHLYRGQTKESMLYGADESAASLTIPVNDSIEEVDDIGIAVANQIDSLIGVAKVLCLAENFIGADSIIAEAMNLLYFVCEQQESISVDIGKYYDEIATLYTQLMPPEFSQNLPENILHLIFEKQISRALDSLVISSEDSIRLYTIVMQQAASYNIPMDWNERIFRALVFLTKGKKGPLLKWLERSRYYVPMMQRMFEENGLPTDLAYLPLIESGYSPYAYSRAHACGIWQFISSTGNRYGLRNNYWIDERRDPIKSTMAAIKYLNKLYNDFGDWYLALAAYNCGEGAVERALSRSASKSFWDLTLPKETMNYVPEFLAALIIAKRPSTFGFTLTQTDTFNLDTVLINECISMQTIADSLGVTIEELKKWNPHILRFCTPSDMKDVIFYLPTEKKEQFRTLVRNLPQQYKVRWYRYRIREGDNLLKIASLFGVSVSGIKLVNNLTTNKIAAGKYLFIPIPSDSKIPYRESQQTSHHFSKNKALTYNAIASTTKNNSRLLRYRVKSGDTIWQLAELFGVTTEDICEWNNISNSAKIRSGDILIIYVPNPKLPQGKSPTKKNTQS